METETQIQVNYLTLVLFSIRNFINELGSSQKLCLILSYEATRKAKPNRWIIQKTFINVITCYKKHT